MKKFDFCDFKIYKYYSFVDCLNKVENIEYIPFSSSVTSISTHLTSLQINATNLALYTDIAASDLQANGLVDKLFQLCLVRFGNNHVLKLEDDALLVPKYRYWFITFLNRISYTYLKYKTLLDSYSTEKAHLLDKLQDGTSVSGTNTGTVSNSGSNSSVSKNKFNDTPQELGDFTGNTYMSEYREITDAGTSANTTTNNLSSSQSALREYDPQEMIDRLTNIENKFSNVMENWLNDMEVCFMESEEK